MKGIAICVAGLTVGVLCTGLTLAQETQVRGLNHIGINVANYDEALAFHTKTLGIREAYTVRNADGTRPESLQRKAMDAWK